MMYVDEIMEISKGIRVLSHAICLWDDFIKIMNGTKVPWQIAQIALKYEAYGNYVMQKFEFNFPLPPSKIL